MNTKAKGDIAEAKVLSALIGAGYTVLRPFGDNEKYDLVIESKGQFYKVQVKSLRQKGKDQVKLPIYYQNYPYCDSSNLKSYKVDQVDYFAGYSHELDQIILIPINEINQTRYVTFRLNQPKHRETKRTRYFQNYII